MTRTLSLIAAVSVLVAAGCTKESKTEDKARDRAGESASAPGAAAKADPSAANDEMARARRLADHPVGEVAVNDLASLIDDGACAVFDANTDSTRKKLGLIPTATALSHYREFGASELPEAKDTKLVFYCSNTSCRASHTAAEKAILAGYDDVNVLPAGIMGWRDAGKDTRTYHN